MWIKFIILALNLHKFTQILDFLNINTVIHIYMYTSVHQIAGQIVYKLVDG